MKHLTVKSITRFRNHVEVIFDGNVLNDESFCHDAGQYISITVNIDGKEKIRSYSLTGLDHETTIKICVKRVINGAVSNYIFDKLNIGDQIKSSLPTGHFVLKKRDLVKGQNYIFITGGSGVTPLIPMIKEVLDFGDFGEILLIYGNSDKDSIIYDEILEGLSDKIRLIHVLEECGEKVSNGQIVKGLLSPTVIDDLLDKSGLDLLNSSFFLSGPPAVISNTEQVLDDKNVSLERIRKEQFFIDAMKLADGQEHRIRIRVQKRFESNLIRRNTSILDGCLDNGKNISYSCRVGECKQCACKLLKGSVNHNGEIISEKRNILSCQAFPLSEDVIVDFKKNLIERHSKYRSYALLLFFFVGIFLVIGARHQLDDSFIASGPMNTGHESISCTTCHIPEKGSTRQQIQSNLNYYLYGNEARLSFVHKSVDNQNCLNCHNREQDNHSVHRFNEPKFKEVREKLHPEKCVSCHMEHNGVRMTLNDPNYCMNCHQSLKIRKDPISPSHEQLINSKNWGVCLQCHDYHGNHIRETPISLSDTIPKSDLQSYFLGGKDPYSRFKLSKATNSNK